MGQFSIDPQILEKMRDAQFLNDAFASGQKLSDLLGFSPETMALMYKSAHHFFTEHQYEQALQSFLFLATLDPDNFDYWLGLGMSAQMTGDYEAGIDAYEMAAFIEVENPVSYFYLSKCFFSMHDHENAKQALEMAIEYAEDSQQYADLKQQAHAALLLIKKT